MLLAPFVLLAPLAVLAPFALQRAPVPGREAFREPFAGRAELRLEDSALGRRAVRLAEDACAGLRSRECAAGRLKCGRVGDDFCVATGLCGAGMRGA